MNKVKLWGGLSLAVAIVLAGLIAWWALDVRWRPKTIGKHQAEIAKILETSGWVSPNLGPNKLYMISFRGCPACLTFKADAFPKLHKAKVDTRVIVTARRDSNGASHSTPAERATVAQLWLTRSWPLFEDWHTVAEPAWPGAGIPPADGDMARTAVVEAGRNMVDDLIPLLADNGIDFAYPLLIWWTKDGEMHGCACGSAMQYNRALKELGV
jgi:hypothetical protein